MRPKPLLLILLHVAISQGYAQGIHLQGAITDARTGNPLGGATISISAKFFFTLPMKPVNLILRTTALQLQIPSAYRP